MLNLTIEQLKRYHGCCLDDFTHLTEAPYRSQYNHNYYQGFDGDILYESGNGSEGYLLSLLVDDEWVIFADTFDGTIEVFDDNMLRDIIENGTVYC